MWEKRLSNDWFVVFVVIFLFLIPLYLIPEIPLFGPSIVGNASNYGFVVYIVLILDFVWWVAKESKAEHFPEKHFDHPRVPMEQATSCHWVRCWMSRWRTNVAYREGFSSIVSPIGLVADMLLVAPLNEEVLFRGYLINRLLRSNRTFQKRILAIAAVILIFSWTHANYPEQKVVGGIIFTAVYLWR